MIRRALTALFLVAVAGAAVVLMGASGDDGKASREYKIEFDNAFGLTSGGDLKVGGVRAGKTKSFSLTEGDRPKAVVVVEVTEPEFELTEDSRCEIAPQSLIGEYFVDCQPGDGEKLKEGGTLHVETPEGGGTFSVIPQDLVNNVLRRPYRERLRLIIAELGTGLAGRPEDLSEVLRRAHPGLRETSEALEVLGEQNRVIERFVVDSDRVVGQLEDRKRDVQRWVTETRQTAEISASRRTELAAQFERLPTFLREFRPTLAALSDLTEEQTPLLRDLRTVAPALVEFFERIGPFSEASRPAFRSLGSASRAGSAAIDESQDEVDTLRDLAAEAPRLGRPLRQFLQSIDTRRRSAEPDPRAQASAPPSPDPTAYRDGDGFTGMESFWNYWLWQGLTINKFDELSHFLSVLGIVEACSPYVTSVDLSKPDEKEHAEHCNSWIGPYQPGITVPDPTEQGTAARERAERRNPGRDRSAPRGAGEPEAPPIPGDRDPSEPQVVLPPSIQGLLDALPQIGVGPAIGGLTGQRGGEPTTTQLLDFLLAP